MLTIRSMVSTVAPPPRRWATAWTTSASVNVDVCDGQVAAQQVGDPLLGVTIRS